MLKGNEPSFSDFTPKYYRIKQILIKEILEGKYLPNDRIPSVTQIMSGYDVSRLTASRVIDELSKQGITYAVQGKGCFVASPKDVVETQKIESKRMILIIPYLMSDFFAPLIQGVLDVVQVTDYKLETYCSKEDYLIETRLLSKCLEEPIAGLILIPSSCEEDYRHLFQIQKKGIPVVLAHRNLNNYNFDRVVFNNVKGARDAVEYLLKEEHRKIAFIGANKNNSVVQERLEGYKKAFEKNGLEVDPNLIYIIEEKIEDNIVENETHRIIEELINNKTEFTAIFTTDDGLAYYAKAALNNKGLKVPDDISLVGYGDFTSSKSLNPPLTTVGVDMHDLGKQAVKMLFKRINSKMQLESLDSYNVESKFVKTKLIIRDSVKNRGNYVQ